MELCCFWSSYGDPVIRARCHLTTRNILWGFYCHQSNTVTETLIFQQKEISDFMSWHRIGNRNDYFFNRHSQRWDSKSLYAPVPVKGSRKLSPLTTMEFKLDFNRAQHAKASHSFFQETVLYAKTYKKILKQSRWWCFHSLRFVKIQWCWSDEMFDKVQENMLSSLIH